MNIVTLFTDTNGFIQLKDLKNLKWRDLFPGVKHVRIMVAKPVTEELGQHKNSGRDRLRNRSRLALDLIEKASGAPERTLMLKEKPVKITLEVPRIKRPDWDALDDLDPSSPDDRLVAAAVTYGNGAAIFTHDTGPRITAHDHGLAAYKPLDDWHLEPDQSDDQRKIGELQRALAAARSTKPELAIEIEGRDTAGKLTLYRPILPPLDAVQVDRLLKRYLEEYPRASLVATPRFYAVAMGDGLTEHQVSSYHGKYDAFEDKAKSFLQRLHELAYYLVIPTAAVKTTNLGTVSAVNFHVTLQTTGGFGLLSNAKAIRKVSPFPEPPEKPEPLGYLGGLHNHLWRGGVIPSPPHPTEIVWIDKPSHGEDYGRYGCQDFQPERSYVRIVALWPDDHLPVTGMLKVTAGANDVPDISEQVEVTIEDREESWQSPQVIESIPKFLRTEMKALKWDAETYENLKKLGKPKSARPSAAKVKKGEGA